MVPVLHVAYKLPVASLGYDASTSVVKLSTAGPQIDKIFTQYS